MAHRVERVLLQAGSVLRLLGRVEAQHLDELRSQLKMGSGQISFDLEEVALVDAEAVRFFVRSEREGITVFNASPYIREWMKRLREGQG